MDGSESGNDVVFCSAYISFSEVGAVIVGGDELYNARRCGGAEKRFDFGGGFVIGDEVCDGVAEVGEERKGGRESFYTGGGVFGRHGGDVSASVVCGDKEVFHAASRLVWKSSSKVGSSPILSGDEKGLCFDRNFIKSFCLFRIRQKRFGRGRIF